MKRIQSWRRPVLALAFAASAGVATAGCGVTMQQEAQIGAQYAAEINRQVPLVHDASLNRYINDLGRSIARQAQRPFNYQFYIVNTDQINAFALPGGYVYINRGLIARAENMSEFAGVLAHEIAHVELRHGAEQLERAQHANIGLTVAYVLMGRAPTGLEGALIDVGGSIWFARHGREAEHDADLVAVQLLVQSGIDPRGLTSFFNKLMQDQQRQPSRVEQWFSTHPLTTERIATTQAVIQQYPAQTLSRLAVDTPGYQNFRGRLQSQPMARN